MSRFNRAQVAFIIGAVAFIAVAASILITQGKVANAPVSVITKATSTPNANGAPDMKTVMLRLADDDPSAGPENAPVIMVEFSDYLCPWCGKFYFDILPRLLAAYPTQLRYVHRDYPVLGMDDQDAPLRAAVAAGCALAQGHFWEMHSRLFEPYRNLDMSKHMQGEKPDPAEREAMTASYKADALRVSAQTVGLDMSAYDRCVAAQMPAAEVQHDLNDGMQLGLNSVPTYIINGMMVQGAQSFEVFSQIIDQRLAESPLN